jgi:hypothetical protein
MPPILPVDRKTPAQTRANNFGTLQGEPAVFSPCLRRSRVPCASSVPNASRRWFQNPAEALQPDVDLLQGHRVDGVQAPGAVRADGREAGLPQHSQVLRYRRLRDPELCPDDPADRACGLLAVGEQLQYPASHRVAEHDERLHDTQNVSRSLFKSRPNKAYGWL